MCIYRRWGIAAWAGLLSVALATLAWASGYDPRSQTAALTLDEARTVYLGNLARRANGRAPLRWNRQLTYAARWFAWDAVENRLPGFCGHQDTQDGWPSTRTLFWGYLGFSGAENAYCGYLTPEAAIAGWLASSGHRTNLLDPNSREIGLGYYRRASDGRGYVTQDFGHDPVYPPVIINDEALTTTTPAVNLYTYDRESGGGFAGLAPAAQMQVSNTPCFGEAAWEPYQAERPWSLTAGAGWRQVYVKTRDVLSRTLTVSDTIYLGANLPLSELGAAQMSSTQAQVPLYNLNSGGLPQMQFSQGWLADDANPNFSLQWGNGEQFLDSAAWGGTAFRLAPPGGGVTESFAWVWTTSFITNTPLVAYFRLKVADNTSTAEVARVSVKGGGTEYGPLRLRGVDFTAPHRYQEFPLAFTFNTNPSDTFLIFQFWRSGATDVYVDAVSIFTAPQPYSPTWTWTVPGGNYRGRGVQVRNTDGGSQFSEISEPEMAPPSLALAPAVLAFLIETGGSAPAPQAVQVSPLCQPFAWTASANRTWLQAWPAGGGVEVSVDPAGLTTGVYSGTLSFAGTGEASGAQAALPVTLRVVDQLYFAYFPLVLR